MALTLGGTHGEKERKASTYQPYICFGVGRVERGMRW